MWTPATKPSPYLARWAVSPNGTQSAHVGNICAPLPDELDAWQVASDSPPILPKIQWSRGDPTTCPEREACWLTSSRHTNPSAAPSAAVTLFLSSSARPSDADRPLEVVEAIRSTRRALGLTSARAVVIYDGLVCKPRVTPAIANDYASKIEAVHRALHREHEAATAGSERHAPYTLLLYQFWLFKAEALRRALQLLPPTPLVYVSEDDRAIAGGPVDGAMLVQQLLTSASPRVMSVRFSSYRDACDVCKHAEDRAPCCSSGSRHCRQVETSNSPCTRHPATPLLHKVTGHDDGPNLARREYYLRRIFEEVIGRNQRVTMEPSAWVSYFDAMRGDDWGIWIYGARGDMKRNVHYEAMGGGSSYGAGTGDNRVDSRARNQSQLQTRPAHAQPQGVAPVRLPPLNVHLTFAHEPDPGWALKVGAPIG